MHILIVFVCMLFISAHMSFSQNYPFNTPCEVNPDRWEIRKPNQEEANEYGLYVLVFEYYNSINGCSGSLNELGLYFDKKRMAILSVVVGNEDLKYQEQITLDVLTESGYVLFDDHIFLIPDSDELHKIILYPIGY